MAKEDFTDDSSSGMSSRRAEGSAGFYDENAFRVLGMPVDATDMEIQERHGVLKAYASLKRIKEVYTIAWGLNPPPSERRLDEALERLNNGEQRAYDEFFWFWPREVGDEDDPGLAAIAEGSANEARRHWREWEQEPGQGRAVARHNLAVDYLLQALEETSRHLAGSSGKSKEQLENAWKNADKRWHEIAADGREVWTETKKRILGKEDRALTAALADKMKNDLSETLALIHGDLALRYVQRSQGDWAKFHCGAMFLGRTALNDADRDIIRRITKPVRDSLEAARKRAQFYNDSSKPEEEKRAFAEAKRFFESDFEVTAQPVLELFYGFGDDYQLKTEKNNLYDGVARTVKNCCVTAFNAKQKADERTDDDTALLTAALVIATDPELREQIKKNGGIDPTEPTRPPPPPDLSPEFMEFVTTLGKIAENKDPALSRFKRLQEMRPKVHRWVDSRPESDEECRAFMKLFAAAERSISIDIFNEAGENAKAGLGGGKGILELFEHIRMALTAICCAVEDTSDEDDRKKFLGDYNQLAEMAKQMGVDIPATPSRRKRGGPTPINTPKPVVRKPTPPPPPPVRRSAGQSRWLLGLVWSLFILTGVFYYYYPSGITVSGILRWQNPTIAAWLAGHPLVANFVVRWWHIYLLGIVGFVPRLLFLWRQVNRGSKLERLKILFRIAEPGTEKWRWMFIFAVTMFILWFPFRHYFPNAHEVVIWPFTGQPSPLQWWRFPLSGLIFGVVFPWGMLRFPLRRTLMAFHLYGWFFTLSVWLSMLVHNAIVAEASVWALWLAPLVGFGLSFLTTILYAIGSKGK